MLVQYHEARNSKDSVIRPECLSNHGLVAMHIVAAYRVLARSA